MKKKFLKGFLLTALFCVTLGSLNSCKDTNEDEFNEFRIENLTLQQKIDALSDQLNNLQQAYEECCKTVKADMKVLEDRIKAAETEIAYLKANSATKEELAQAEERLRKEIMSALTDYVTHQELANKLKETIESIQLAQKAVDDAQDVKINGLDGRVTVLEGLVQDATSKLNTVYNWMLEMQKQGIGDPAVLKQLLDNTTNEIADLKKQLASLQKQVNKGYDDSKLIARIAALEDMLKGYTDLTKTVNNMQTTINNFMASFKQYGGWDQFFAIFNKMDTTVTQHTDSIAKFSGDLSKLHWLITRGDELANLMNSAENIVYKADLNNVINPIKSSIDSLNNAFNEKLNDYATVKDLTDKYNELKALIENNKPDYTEIYEKIAEVAKQANDNKAAIEDINNQLDVINQTLTDLSGRIDAINNRLNRLITGIIPQRLVAPAIGFGVTDPFGMEFNVLLSMYGTNELGTTQFPAFGSSAGSYNDDLVLTSADRKRIEAAGVKITEPERLSYNEPLMGDFNGNAGRVYLSVNPSNVDFSGAEFDLVTSVGNSSPIKLGQLRHSTYELMHGVSRVANNNFYEADAYIAPANAGQAAITVEPGLKSSLKEVIHDRSKGAVVELAKALLHQVNNKLPAYALRAQYNDGKEDVQVVSTYNIAAATYTPLSFKTGFGLSYENKMPVVGHHDFVFDIWNYIDRSKLNAHMTFPGLNGDNMNFSFKLSDIEFNYNDSMKLQIDGTVTLDGVSHEFKGDVSKESIQRFLNEFANKFNANLHDKWNAELEAQVKDAMNTMLADINRQVQDIIDEKCAKANDKIDQFAQELNDKVNDKLAPWVDRFDKLIDKYDAVRERMSRFLSNPNHYLQPMMFVKGGKLIEVLSNKPEDPTPVKLGSGDCVMMYATTYNAEIVVPTYKKYFVVTNVYRSDNKTINADNNATCRALLKEANTNGVMNTLVTGRNNRVPLKVSHAGYTYEIAYSALDYRGANSSVKYYVAVINE